MCPRSPANRQRSCRLEKKRDSYLPAPAAVRRLHRLQLDKYLRRHARTEKPPACRPAKCLDLYLQPCPRSVDGDSRLEWTDTRCPNLMRQHGSTCRQDVFHPTTGSVELTRY